MYVFFPTYVDQGHTAPPADQTAGSKCPFLAAEMMQNNSLFVKEASVELRQEVKEIQSLFSGERSHDHTWKFI